MSDNDLLMVTEKTAKSFGLPYIKEVAERAGMSDEEIVMALSDRGWIPAGNDDDDGNSMLSVIIEAYTNELKVHNLVNKINPPKNKLSWRDIFDTSKGRYDISTANASAKKSGYDKFYWNGSVLDIDTHDNAVPNYISYEDFSKVDIRAGTITKSELVPKSEKLLKLEVYFGEQIGHRVILASLAKSYDVTMIVGQNVLAVVNLAPRKIMGVESHGMILAAYRNDGKLALASCSEVPYGSQIG